MAVAVSSVLALLGYLRLLRRLQPSERSVVAAMPATAEILSYITTYLFPFLEADYEDLAVVGSLAGIYAVILIIQVKANLIHVNPALLLLGYHVLAARLTDSREVTLIARRSYIPPSSHVRAVMAGDHIMVEVPS